MTPEQIEAAWKHCFDWFGGVPSPCTKPHNTLKFHGVPSPCSSMKFVALERNGAAGEPQWTAVGVESEDVEPDDVDIDVLSLVPDDVDSSDVESDDVEPDDVSPLAL